MKKIAVGADVLMDIEQIAIGGFSPLEGFMKSADYNSVLDNIRLKDGTIWSVPITLSTDKKEAKKLKRGEELLITDEAQRPIAILQVEEIYPHNKTKRCKAVYATTSLAHPGVKAVKRMGDVLLGGEIKLLNRPKLPLGGTTLTPKETRQIFKKRGWKTVCAFHTRNAVHRAHEYLQRCALEFADGLFINPIAGETKKGDFSSNLVMGSYKYLIEHYYPKQRVLLAPLNMRMAFAGPREALFHAIVRKNYGCTHVVIGRDHAGVKNYYDTYAAHRIFDKFDDLGITPLRFSGPFYCKRCKAVATEKTCSHRQQDRLAISGTKIRRMFSTGITPPEEFMRPEVSKWIKAKAKKGGIFK